MLLYKLYIELGRKQIHEELEFEFVQKQDIIPFSRKRTLTSKKFISVSVRGDNMPVYTFSREQILSGSLSTAAPSVFTKIIGGGTPSLSILLSHTVCRQPEYELGLDGIWHIGDYGDPDFLKHVWDFASGGTPEIPAADVEMLSAIYNRYGMSFMDASLRASQRSTSGWWCVIV